MKKILLAIPYFLLWVLYYLATSKERELYAVGKSKGKRCTSVNDISLLIPGSVIEYEFDDNAEPVRDYLTWNEFWSKKGY